MDQSLAFCKGIITGVFEISDLTCLLGGALCQGLTGSIMLMLETPQFIQSFLRQRRSSERQT